jgi:hypothetical protein
MLFITVWLGIAAAIITHIYQTATEFLTRWYLYESSDSEYCVRVSISNSSYDLTTELLNISTFLKPKRIIFTYSRILGELMIIFSDRREKMFSFTGFLRTEVCYSDDQR